MNSVIDKIFFDRLYHHSDITESVFGIDCKKNITYLKAGKTPHTLDIFTPEGSEESLPLIINIHCEGFIYENKNYDDNFCAYLASKGFCVISVKLAPAVSNGYRDLVEDVTDAFIWISRNASLYKADTSNAFLCADSVAANLSLVALCINGSELMKKIYKVEEFSLSFKAIGLSSPVTEISFINRNPLLFDVKKALFGESPKESPYLVCSSFKSVLERSKPVPPMYFVSSVDDPMNTQSMSLASLCRKRNIDHRFKYCDSGKFYKLSHAFNVLFPEYAESMTVNNEMIDFFKANM